MSHPNRKSGAKKSLLSRSVLLPPEYGNLHGHKVHPGGKAGRKALSRVPATMEISIVAGSVRAERPGGKSGWKGQVEKSGGKAGRKGS